MPSTAFRCRPVRGDGPAPGAQRGSTLLESLLAFVLLATGTLALASLQTSLRLHADVARQRSEAVRLAERELESLRAFSAMAAGSSPHAFAAIADTDSIADRSTGDDTNTTYRIALRVDAATVAGAKSVSVAVAWQDRSGSTQRVRLDSIVAGIDPAYSAALALGAGDGLSHGVMGRSALVPVSAHVLGDGRSVFKPTATTALVFDDRSGDVVARCSAIAAATQANDLTATDLADLAGCVRGTWASASGVIRFSSASPPDAVHARDPTPAVSIALALSGTGYPAPADCSSEAMKSVRYIAGESLHIASVALDAVPASLGVAAWEDDGDRFVAYRCLIAPRPDGHWSGRVSLVPDGWAIGSTAAARRVCRYLGDSGAAPSIEPRAGHQAEEVDGTGSLTGQNFVVVRGDQPCPPATLASDGVAAFAGTVQHQP